MKSFVKRHAITVVAAIGLLAGIYLLCTFPSSFIWDMYWDPIDAEEIEQLNYNPFKIAGLPAGEGIQVLETKEQFDNIHYEEHHEFYTFETDSIIPLNVYKMKSGTDSTNDTYRVGNSQTNSGIQWSTYAHSAWSILWRRNIYNRYYLVELPDGNYVVSYLDDSYYLKYLLNNKVQLPVGYVYFLTPGEKKELQSEMEKYGLDEDHYLVMFSQTRYEENKGSYTTIALAVFICAMALYFGAAVVIMVILDTKKRKLKNGT